MNQVFASGQEGQGSGKSGGDPEELRIHGLEQQVGLAMDLLQELKERLAEEPPSRPLRRPQRTRPRVRGGGGHLPHGVKFYVIGGALAILGFVVALPRDNPVKVVVVRTADYLVQQLPNLPGPPQSAAPQVAGFSTLPILGPHPDGQPVAGQSHGGTSSSTLPVPSPPALSPGQTVAAVTPVSPPAPTPGGLDPGSSSPAPVGAAAPAVSSQPPPAPAPAAASVPAVDPAPAPPPATPVPPAPRTPDPTAVPTPVPTATPAPVPSPTAAPSVLAVPPTPVASSDPSPSPTP